MSEHIPVERDENRELAVPTEWRETIRTVVDRFVNGDFQLRNEVESVAPIPLQDSSHIKRSLDTYGDALVALPPEAWNTSIYQATLGGWEVLVDLYTESEGPSDLVLFLFVKEAASAYCFKVQSVHVP